MGTRIRRALVTSVAATAALLSSVAPAGARETLDYVALGDSAAAGPLIPNQNPNIACLRSDTNYPRIAAARLGARLHDVTCSGAKIADFSGRQYGFLAPQYDALSRRTDLVTVTIGGNDMHLVRAALTCLNALPEPVGFSCADRYTAGGRDELADRVEQVRPRFGQALEEIRRRAPHAEIVVVGYGTYLRPDGCYPKEPVWARDANYLQATVNRLSAMLRQQASAHGARFVDLAPVSVGHDVCAPVDQKYFEGVVPTSVAAPLHPNAKGMAAFGRVVAESVDSVSPVR